MKYYLTTPIYYANAKPHIGSAYPTIAADVLARHYAQQKADVWFLVGTAEHGTKIAASAEKAGKSPQEFVDENAQHFKTAWDKLNIKPSDFIRTTEKRHEQAVVVFFEKLRASGKIYQGTYEGLYCVGHETFIKEADLDPQGRCPDHQTVPEKISEQNWFFKLSDYADILKEKIERDELCIEPASRKKEVLTFINQGLEDISISRHNVPWAIPLPWDETQTIYVWLDELFNYCSAIGYASDGKTPGVKGSQTPGVEEERGFSYWWPADLHIVGKDIIKFHCIIWPALLLAINELPPKKVFAHGFFTVNGQKISKSLGNAIDPVVLANEYGSDAVRYFLLREIPFGSDGDFSVDRLKERYNADLANGLGNLVSRVLNMIQQYWADFDQKPSSTVSDLQSTVTTHLEKLDFDKALEAIWQTISGADELIERTKPWELHKAGKTEEVKKTLQQLYATLIEVNGRLAPFLPDTHQKLTTLLAARPLKKPAEPLFARKK